MLGELESLSLYELHDRLHEVQTAIKEKHSEEWDSVYKRKCPNHYVSFEEFLDTLYLFNDNKFSIKKDEFLYSKSEIWIPNILRDLRNCEYDWNINEYTEKSKFTVPPKLSNMICEACACQGCPSMKEHLGHTCKDCRIAMYTKYEGYCDE